EQFQSKFKIVNSKSPFWINNRADEAALPEPARSALTAISSQLDTLMKNPLPPLVYANGAQEGGVPESPHAGVHDVPLHIRGSYARLGQMVPRGFPEIFGGDKEPAITSGSGRLQLAEWLARPANPVTGRVIV